MNQKTLKHPNTKLGDLLEESPKKLTKIEAPCNSTTDLHANNTKNWDEDSDENSHGDMKNGFADKSIHIFLNKQHILFAFISCCCCKEDAGGTNKGVKYHAQ